jgi:hypothetical protein
VRWLRARKRFTRDVAAKEPIVHWRYPAAEWQSSCQAEAKRIRDRDIPLMLSIFVPVAVIMMGYGWYKYDPAVPESLMSASAC